MLKINLHSIKHLLIISNLMSNIFFKLFTTIHSWYIINYFEHNCKGKVYIFNSTYMEDGFEIQKIYIINIINFHYNN